MYQYYEIEKITIDTVEGYFNTGSVHFPEVYGFQGRIEIHPFNGGDHPLIQTGVRRDRWIDAVIDGYRLRQKLYPELCEHYNEAYTNALRRARGYAQQHRREFIIYLVEARHESDRYRIMSVNDIEFELDGTFDVRDILRFVSADN